MPYASRISVGTTFASFNDPNLKYRIEKRVGSGGFSEVFEIARLKDSKVFALKIVSTIGYHRYKPKKQIFQEEATKLMQSKGHPHIMELEDVMQMPQNAEAGLIMELASEGHLRGLLDRLPKQHHVSLSQRVTYEMVEALHYIHSHDPPIVHRDIKPDNILVFLAGTEYSPHYLFKLADFGLADTVVDDDKEMSGRAYPPFRAPETLMWKPGTHTRGYECSADIWSLGVVLSKLHDVTIDDGTSPALSYLPAQALSLIRSMLEMIPRRRPSAEQCKRYIWYGEGATAVVYKMTNTNTYAGYDSLESMSEMTIDSDSSLEDDCPADSMK
ncbi:kinase-like protein [Aureobasidium subglaciale]|nr:kinase-like protein [Aureobasidium subglaciale]